MIGTTKDKKQEQGFPLYVSGDQAILEHLNLRFETDIALSPQKLHLVSMPFRLVHKNETEQFFNPIIQMEVITQVQRESLMKNRSLFREGVHYVYFPASIRVDQKIYKIYQNNYENLIDRAPKAIRGNFSKFIIWEEGKGQHSIAAQKAKVKDNLSEVVRSQIEKKVKAANDQIKNLQTQRFSITSLKRIFILKNKLSFIFKLIKVNETSILILEGLWKQILDSYLIFSPTAKQENDLNNQKWLKMFKSPFLPKTIQQVVKEFEQPEAYIRTVTFSFIEMFRGLINSMQHFQAIRRVKFFIEQITTYVLVKTQDEQIQLLRYLWIVQLLDKCESILKKVPTPPMKNQLGEQHEKRLVGIWLNYRNGIERAGYLLYRLNNFKVSPTTLMKQLEFVIQTMEAKKSLEPPHMYERQLQVKQIIAPEANLSVNVTKMVSGFDSFVEVYIESLGKLYKALNIEPFFRVAQTLKFTIMKAIILYKYDSTLMHDFNIDIGKEDVLWSPLMELYKILKIPFFRIQGKNLKMRDCLLFLLTDKNLRLEESKWNLLSSYLKDLYEEDQNRMYLGCFSGIHFQKQPELKKNYLISGTIKNWQDKYFMFEKAWVICEETKHQEGQERLLQIEEFILQNEKFKGKVLVEDLLIFNIQGILLETKNGLYFVLQADIKVSQRTFKLNVAEIYKEADEILIYEEPIWSRVAFRVNSNGASKITKVTFSGELEISAQVRFDHETTVHMKQIDTVDLKKIHKQQVFLEFYLKLKYPLPEKERRDGLSPQRKFSTSRSFHDRKSSEVISVTSRKQSETGSLSERKGEQSRIKYQAKPKTIKVEFQLEHNGLGYSISVAQTYSTTRALKLDYFFLQEMEEFSIKNISRNKIVVQQQGMQWQVEKNQQLALLESTVRVKTDNSIFQQIDLSSMVEKLMLKPKKIQYFLLELDYLEGSPKAYGRIGVKSNQIGKLFVKASEGYEMVGKIEGNVAYLTPENKSIDIWIIPLRKGRIILPDIWINQKKGIWTHSPYIQIQ